MRSAGRSNTFCFLVRVDTGEEKTLSSHAHLLNAALGSAPARAWQAQRELQVAWWTVRRDAVNPGYSRHVLLLTLMEQTLATDVCLLKWQCFYQLRSLHRLWFQPCCRRGPDKLMPTAPLSRTFPRQGQPWQLLTHTHGAAGNWAGFNWKAPQSRSLFSSLTGELSTRLLLSQHCAVLGLPCCWPVLDTKATLKVPLCYRQASNESPEASLLVLHKQLPALASTQQTQRNPLRLLIASVKQNNPQTD